MSEPNDPKRAATTKSDKRGKAESEGREVAHEPADPKEAVLRKLGRLPFVARHPILTGAVVLAVLLTWQFATKFAQNTADRVLPPTGPTTETPPKAKRSYRFQVTLTGTGAVLLLLDGKRVLKVENRSASDAGDPHTTEPMQLEEGNHVLVLEPQADPPSQGLAKAKLEVWRDESAGGVDARFTPVAARDLEFSAPFPPQQARPAVRMELDVK